MSISILGHKVREDHEEPAFSRGKEGYEIIFMGQSHCGNFFEKITKAMLREYILHNFFKSEYVTHLIANINTDSTRGDWYNQETAKQDTLILGSALIIRLVCN